MLDTLDNTGEGYLLDFIVPQEDGTHVIVKQHVDGLTRDVLLSEIKYSSLLEMYVKFLSDRLNRYECLENSGLENLAVKSVECFDVLANEDKDEKVRELALKMKENMKELSLHLVKHM